VHNGEQKGSGLATSCLGAREYIAALHGGGDCVELYGSRAHETEFLDALEKIWVKLE
jgi:hypothetical protein